MIQKQLFWGPLVLIYKLPKDIFNKIKSIKPNENYTQGKTGKFSGVEKINNRHGYSNDNMLLIKKLLDGYIKGYISTAIPYPIEYKFESLWVNEYSVAENITPHVHTSCDISFILYMQSNQDIIDEDENVNAGYTVFQYGQPVDGRAIVPYISSNKHRPVDGELVIFPNNLSHYSIPFNLPNVKRFTMSGNVELIPNPQSEMGYSN
tara:strand:+ start:715 stop:1332 length:618 start_codon:yes stop_codon:yes gene_type:complete